MRLRYIQFFSNKDHRIHSKMSYELSLANMRRCGYRPFSKYDYRETHTRFWDNYFEMWIGNCCYTDQIWARSQTEADMVYLHLIHNP